MKTDTIKLIFTYVYGLVVLAVTFYALVLYPFDPPLPDLIQGAFISWATLAINSIFSDQVATRTARQSESAAAAGASQALSTPTPAEGNG